MIFVTLVALAAIGALVLLLVDERKRTAELLELIEVQRAPQLKAALATPEFDDPLAGLTWVPDETGLYGSYERSDALMGD